MMKHFTLIGIVLGLGLFLVACGGVEPTAPPTAESTPTAPPATPTSAPVAAVEEDTEEPVVLVEEHAEETVSLVDEHAEEPLPTPVPPTPTPTPTPAGPARLGLATFSDGEVHSDQITLSIADVPPLPDDAAYEAWLEGETEPPFSLGRLPVEGGAIDYTFLDPRGYNLLGLYNRMFITIEPANDLDPAPSDRVVYAGEITPGVLEQVRLLIFYTPDTPDGDGFALNGLREALRVLEQAGLQQQAVAEGNLANLHFYAEGIINNIEGTNGPNYGDGDGNGQVFDPSDGVGLLSFGDSRGYLQTVIDHANLAAEAEGASAEVVTHVTQAEISAENVTEWAGIIRDLELNILQTSNATDAADLVAGVLDLANALAEGIDTNGDGQIAPVPGEGGLRTLYEQAQLIGAIEFFAEAGVEATPLPVSTPEPTTELISEHDEAPVETPTLTAVPEPTPTPTTELISEHDGG